MLAVISPAKKLNLEPISVELKSTQPTFLADAAQLAEKAKTLEAADLQRLMSISEKLAQLNYERFQSFNTPFNETNASPAALTFNGDTYTGLDAPSLSSADLSYAQSHLGILSGLYGLLRPLDLMQPYRLEMGTRFENQRGKDLYNFWGTSLTEQINRLTEGHSDRSLINLASIEYFKAVKTKHLAGLLVTPVFKEIKGGKAKVVSFMAKRARGMMARYMIEARIEHPDGLKSFTSAGYRFQPAESDGSTLVFSRQQPEAKR